MSEYSEFFFNTSGGIIQFETLEIAHPDFTKTYRVVRNATEGLDAEYEDNVVYHHDYYPMKVTSLGARGDLDQGFRVTFGDLGEILPTELDSVNDADGYSVKPIIKYRTFRSDRLDSILFGPLILEVRTFSFTREGSTFEAKAPQLNINKTGELYKIDRFPMLRGFL